MKSKKLSRRDFLRMSTLTAAGAILAGCGPTPTPETVTVKETVEVPVEQTVVVEVTTETTAIPEPPEEVTLHIMHNWGETDAKGPPLQSIFSDFMEAYPNVTIEQEVFTDEEIPIKVETAFLGKEEPDVVLQNLLASAQTWLENGVTIPVGDLLTEWGFEGAFLDVALAEWTDDQGRLQAFPLEGSNWPVWYNTTILGEAGVEIPTTADELFAAIPKIRDAGHEPIVTGGADWTGYAQMNLIVQSILDRPTAEQLYTKGGFSDNADAMAGVEYFVQLRDAGAFVDDVAGLDFGGRNERYFSGGGAMLHGGSWIYSEAPDELFPHVVLAGFPLPAGSPHEKPLIVAGYSAKGVWITRNGAEKLDVIEEFVKFFYQPKMIARFVEQGSMPAPLKDVPVDEGKLNPLFVQSLQLADDVTMMTGFWGRVPGSVRPTFLNIAKEAYIDLTAEEILADLKAAYEAAE